MSAIEIRLKALELREEPIGQLPTVVNDNCSDAEIERLRRKGHTVYRMNDPKLMDEFI
jgi:hypothetical protein